MYATNRSLVRQLAARTTPAGLRFAGDALGLGLICAAAFMWDPRAGLAALGIAVLLLVARTDG